MTLRELAHLAQQTLQNHAGCPVKRSHVHELLAAAFGHRSWAAFRATAVLANAGVGEGPSGASSQLIGRAVQLGYHQQAAAEMAQSFLAFIAEHQLSSVSWSALGAGLAPPVVAENDAQDDDHEEFDEDEPAAPVRATGATREQLMRSPMLISSLEEAAASSNPQAHFILAALYRCRTPNPYLYEESLKGRVLNAAERGWVDDYLRLEPQHRKYEAHLKAAALGGVRAAALEYGIHFENREFITLPSGSPEKLMPPKWRGSLRRRRHMHLGCTWQPGRAIARHLKSLQAKATRGQRSTLRSRAIFTGCEWPQSEQSWSVMRCVRGPGSTLRSSMGSISPAQPWRPTTMVASRMGSSTTATSVGRCTSTETGD